MISFLDLPVYHDLSEIFDITKTAVSIATAMYKACLSRNFQEESSSLLKIKKKEPKFTNPFKEHENM